MEKALIFLMILAIVVSIGSVVAILVIVLKSKLKSLRYRIDVSEKNIITNLKDKKELVTRSIGIIERQLKIESKKFEIVKKSEGLNNIELDDLLNDASKEILDIKDDYKEVQKIKSFNGIISDMKDIDILLSGSKKFYNRYVNEYNKLIKSFPYNIFSKKYEQITLYNENSEDFKIDL